MSDMERELECVAHLIQQGRFGDALEDLQGLEPQLTDDGVAWQLRGQAHFGLGEHDKAMSALEYAALLIPLNSLAQCQLAECYLRFRRRELAEVVYLHLSTFESLPEVEVVAVACGLAQIGERHAALKFGMAQLKRFRRNHRLLALVAETMRSLDYDADVILPFAYQAHNIHPQSVSYRIAFAQLLVEANRHLEAVRLLNAVDLDELNCIPALERMRILFEQLDLEEDADHCRARLQAIAYQASSTYRPRKDVL